MERQQQFLTENDCYKAGRLIQPKDIMIHSVGVAQPNPDIFIRQWNQSKVPVCVHAFVTDSKVVQTLPWNYRGWHCGSGVNGSANNTHISIECCEPSGHTYQGGTMIGYNVERNQPFFQKLYDNLVKLCANLCQEFKLNPLQEGVLICHAEGFQKGIASNHADVLQWWPKHNMTMEQFRRDVQDELEGDEDMTQEKFNEMMTAYLEQRGVKAPAGWSEQARGWAEGLGVISGDAGGKKRYASFATREEIVQMLYQMFKNFKA